MRSILAAAFLAAFFLSVSAEAQGPFNLGSVAFTGSCGAYSDVTKALLKNRSMQVIQRGVTAQGHGLEIFADAAGAWMFVYRFPDGMACTLDAGEFWETMPLKRGTAA